MTLDLFDSPSRVASWHERLGPGAVRCAASPHRKETTLLAALQGVIAVAPFRPMVTPGGFRMSVAMTNCGSDAAAQAGFSDFVPDSCLINRYEPGARLSLHQDKNERDFDEPIVSVSLGNPPTG